MTLDEIAPKVGAKTGAEIRVYERNEGDVLLTVLFCYAKLAGCPIENLIDGKLEVRRRKPRVLEVVSKPE